MESRNGGTRDDVATVDERTRELAQNPNNITANTERGIARYRLGNLFGALTDLNRAIAMGLACVDPRIWDRIFAMEEAGNHEAAAKTKQRRADALQCLPRAREYRAHARRRLSDPLGAVEDYTKLIEDDLTRVDLYLCRGVARGELGDADGAIADYSEVIERDPTSGPAYYNRGRERGMTGDLDGALTDLDKAVELNPVMASAYSNRAIVWRRKGDLDAAIADSTRAIELESACAAAYVNRSVAWLGKRDLARAEVDARKAIDLAPADSHTRTGWRLMQSARGNPVEEAYTSLSCTVLELDLGL